MSEDQQPRDPADELAALERAFRRLTEPLRREIADRHRDAVSGTARPIRRHRLDVIQSVRFSPEDAAGVRAAAERMGFRSASDFLRAVATAAAKPIGFRCPHLQVTCGPGGFESVRAGCGCDMQPVYSALVAAA